MTDIAIDVTDLAIPYVPAAALKGAKAGAKAEAKVTVKAADWAVLPSGKAVKKEIAQQWHKATFGNVVDSMEYHLSKHGNGRTI